MTLKDICLEVWSRLENRIYNKMYFVSNISGTMSFNRLHELVNRVHVDSMFLLTQIDCNLKQNQHNGIKLKVCRDQEFLLFEAMMIFEALIKWSYPAMK